jgi:hypothetical protein
MNDRALWIAVAVLSGLCLLAVILAELNRLMMSN